MIRSRFRVIVVDHDALARVEIDRQLETLGWEAVPVDTGEDAIRIVELGFVIDVLLTDLSPPDLDGPSLAGAVANFSPKTRIAFMASVPPRDLSPLGGAPCLLKPFSSTELAIALADAKPLNPSR